MIHWQKGQLCRKLDVLDTSHKRTVRRHGTWHQLTLPEHRQGWNSSSGWSSDLSMGINSHTHSIVDKPADPAYPYFCRFQLIFRSWLRVCLCIWRLAGGHTCVDRSICGCGLPPCQKGHLQDLTGDHISHLKCRLHSVCGRGPTYATTALSNASLSGQDLKSFRKRREVVRYRRSAEPSSRGESNARQLSTRPPQQSQAT